MQILHAETLATLLEQISALEKSISTIQGDINRWKEQEQQFSEEEMYNAEEFFLASRSTLVIDLVTDSTSKSRKIPPINEEAQLCPHH